MSEKSVPPPPMPETTAPVASEQSCPPPDTLNVVTQQPPAPERQPRIMSQPRSGHIPPQQPAPIQRLKPASTNALPTRPLLSRLAASLFVLGVIVVSCVLLIHAPAKTTQKNTWPKLPGLRGVHVVKTDTIMSITFDETLFEQWADLSPSGRARLQALGRALKGKANGFKILIEGHAAIVDLDPACPYPNNATLGLGRARIAASVLGDAAGLNKTQIQTVSLGGHALISPAGSRHSKQNNCALTIKLFYGLPPAPALQPVP